MRHTSATSSFFIGWDVGAWNCGKNRQSRDAIVILNNSRTIVGRPWRGNLRECITSSAATRDWLKALFSKCDAECPVDPEPVTMAIDTPLGFSDELVTLVTGANWHEPDETSGSNRYLFRQTERHLFDLGMKPLSAIKDMIGSQAAKGMHVLAKFAPRIESCGVWSDGQGFRAIETYPTACRDTKALRSLLKGRKMLSHADLNDALVCALVAYLFATQKANLSGPSSDVPKREGWIWTPKQ